MEQIRFTNKVWTGKNSGILSKILKALVIIYAVLNIIVIVLEGFSWASVAGLAFAFFALFFSAGKHTKEGKYVESECILTFYPQYLVCEYPQMDLQDGRGIMSVKYIVWNYAVKSLALSRKMQSIRLRCRPVIECVDKMGRQEIRDCSKSGGEVSLILYLENPEKVCKLMERYLEISADDAD